MPIQFFGIWAVSRKRFFFCCFFAALSVLNYVLDNFYIFNGRFTEKKFIFSALYLLVAFTTLWFALDMYRLHRSSGFNGLKKSQQSVLPV